ncbi:hypothetical protein [Burkholderia ubonensis]|uniref:Lipoprotein n=1 Tax=Burkholderia ubonensis TaxID=101571 RepID=A0A125G6T4_9BURK|nr:hypothetical protein [Burkholderia ubonensis]KWD85133.1 hypothetical protein WL70_13765 [Burkholderia ubonensis]KWD92339.1 hypothetical protein WL71_03480 [Burkholderia ubonensis]KWD94180.1 hypothetical protein WL72_26140 [Burkholderia ubonensis]KWD97059.1 hypothetical protein WL73_21685 [Burkholderia ubonensis]
MDNLKRWLWDHAIVIGSMLVIVGCLASLHFLKRETDGASASATNCTIDHSGVEPAADGNLVVKKGTRIACDGVPGRGTAYQVSN